MNGKFGHTHSKMFIYTYIFKNNLEDYSKLNITYVNSYRKIILFVVKCFIDFLQHWTCTWYSSIVDYRTHITRYFMILESARLAEEVKEGVEIIKGHLKVEAWKCLSWHNSLINLHSLNSGCWKKGYFEIKMEIIKTIRNKIKYFTQLFNNTMWGVERKNLNFRRGSAFYKMNIRQPNLVRKDHGEWNDQYIHLILKKDKYHLLSPIHKNIQQVSE